LAAVDATTGDAFDWNPSPGYVVQSVLSHGDALYVGGQFARVGGQPRASLAAISAATAALLPWSPTAEDSYFGTPTIAALAASGETIYLGGTFTAVNGSPREGLAAVDGVTGALLPWDPEAETNSEVSVVGERHVRTLAVSGGAVWAGGMFSTIHGLPRARLAAIDPVSGAPTSWRPDPDGDVHSILVAGT